MYMCGSINEDNAIEKARALSEALKPYDAESIEELIENARADVIVEYVTRLEAELMTIMSVDKVRHIIYHAHCVAEQLMEKK